jgi:hypothetical protein
MIEKELDNDTLRRLTKLSEIRKKPLVYRISEDTIVFETHSDYDDFINANFFDHIPIKMRLDSIEGILNSNETLVPQTFITKLKSKLGI